MGLSLSKQRLKYTPDRDGGKDGHPHMAGTQYAEEKHG